MAARTAIALLWQSDPEFEQASELFLKDEPDAFGEMHRYLDQARCQLLCLADFMAIGRGPLPGSTMAISRRVGARFWAHDIGQKDELVWLAKYSVHDHPEWLKAPSGPKAVTGGHPNPCRMARQRQGGVCCAGRGSYGSERKAALTWRDPLNGAGSDHPARRRHQGPGRTYPARFCVASAGGPSIHVEYRPCATGL